MKLVSTAKIEFHILQWAKEVDAHGNMTVIRIDTDDGLIMDLNSSIFLTQLYHGIPVNKAAKIAHMTVKDATEFIDQAIQNNFIKSIDNKQIPDKGKIIKAWLTRIPKKYFDWCLSPFFVVGSLMIIIIGLITAILSPDNFPTFRDFYWHSNPLVSIAGILLINYFLIFLHEVAHFITTRAIGGQAKMLVSHLSTNIVAETEQYHISILPKQHRYITYLAGLYFDLIVVALIFIIEFFSMKIYGSYALLHQIFMVILLLQFNALVWEFGTFYRTDIYYFITDLFNEDDIKMDSQRFLFKIAPKTNLSVLDKIRKQLHKLLFNKNEMTFTSDMRKITKRQKRLYHIYFGISFLGYIANAFMLLTINLPKYLLFTFLAFDYLFKSIAAANFFGIICAILVFLIINDNIIVLPYLFAKDKKK